LIGCLGMETDVRFELDGGYDAPDSNKKGLVQAALAVTDKQLLGVFASNSCQPLCLTMGKNDRIDPLAAAYTVPIDRPDFEHFLRNHKAAASMAAVDSSPFLGDE
jgi:hypothetical protein